MIDLDKVTYEADNLLHYSAEPEFQELIKALETTRHLKLNHKHPSPGELQKLSNDEAKRIEFLKWALPKDKFPIILIARFRGKPVGALYLTFFSEKIVEKIGEEYLKLIENAWRVDRVGIIPKCAGSGTELMEELGRRAIDLWEKELNGEFLFCDAIEPLAPRIREMKMADEEIKIPEKTPEGYTIILFKRKRRNTPDKTLYHEGNVKIKVAVLEEEYQKIDEFSDKNTPSLVGAPHLIDRKEAKTQIFMKGAKGVRGAAVLSYDDNKKIVIVSYFFVDIQKRFDKFKLFVETLIKFCKREYSGLEKINVRTVNLKWWGGSGAGGKRNRIMQGLGFEQKRAVRIFTLSI